MPARMLGHSAVSHSLRPYGWQPAGPSVRGILQARALQWAATPCPGLSPHPGIKPESRLDGSACAGGFFTTRATWEALRHLG